MQTKEEKKIQIDNAVRIFRETLEKTYNKEGIEFYGIGMHSYQGILCGKINIQRLKNKNLKISGELGKDCINEKCIGLPRGLLDYDIYPMVITLFNRDIGNKELSSKQETAQ
jgi:hypothetical protein